MEGKKQLILDTITDLVSGFVFYDRKEDKELSIQSLYDSVKKGEITIDEMVQHFRDELESNPWEQS